jgi:hypothetical protein
MIDSVVTEIRKTSMLSNIRDGAITAMIQLTQSTLTYASYTQQFNDFIWRSRQPFTYDFRCVCFIKGVSQFHLQSLAKSHRSQRNGYCMPLVESQNCLNDLVTDSPHLGRAKGALAPFENLRGSRLSKKRIL